ncbi:DUF1822 family protein [Scytonema sp. UIC 10036]|nr:DUF1822 family protein [Scytonema sp. UIC 10036]
MNQTEVTVGVQICPTGDRSHLPNEIQVRLLDEAGNEVGKASASVTQTIEFDFNGQYNESFSVEITCGDRTITETFVI